MNHDWVVLVPFKLTDGQAAAANSGSRLNLDMEMVHPEWRGRDGAVDSPVGCFKCEELWINVHGKPCPGQPPGKLEYVT